VGPAPLILNLVQEQRSPGMDGRIDVAKIPLVRRNLAIGMEVEIAKHKELLLFGEIEINQRQGKGVKGEIPSCIPRIFPLIGHGDNVAVKHVEPFRVALGTTNAVQKRMSVMLVQPTVKVEVIILLCPHHPRDCLPKDAAALVFFQRRSRDSIKELICVGKAVLEYTIERVRLYWNVGRLRLSIDKP